MQKPQNYESINVGDFTPITPGGHLCIIKQVKEEKSKSGLDMLVISLDTDRTDAQPNYFTEQFKNDIRPDKKWGCVMYLVVDNSTEYGSANLKKFCTSVEESNVGFSTVWGDKFENCFKGKKVGVVFGREQYLNASGEVKWSTKPKYFRSTNTVLSAEIPKEKLLPEGASSSSNASITDGFMNIPDNVEDAGLPFN